MPKHQICASPDCERRTYGIKPDSVCLPCLKRIKAERLEEREDRQKAIQAGKGTEKTVMASQERDLRFADLPSNPEKAFAKAMRGKSYAG